MNSNGCNQVLILFSLKSGEETEAEEREMLVAEEM